MSLLRLVAGSSGTGGGGGIRKTSDYSILESDFSTHVFFCKECHRPLKLASLYYSCEKQNSNKAKDHTEPDGAEASDAAPLSHAQTAQCGDDGKDDDRGQSHGAEAGERVDVTSEEFSILRNVASPPQAETISHHALVKGRLHDLLSSGSQVQDPLCQDCTDILMTMEEEQLKLMENDNKALRDYYDKILAENEGVDEAALDEELKQLREEEARLTRQLDRQLTKLQQTRSSRLQAEKELRELETEGEEWKRERCVTGWECLGVTDDKQSIRWQMECTEAQSRKLTFPSAIEATFSDLRKLMQNASPQAKVDWNEINTGWGQAILLLQQLASMVGLQFERYHLVPYGNRSYIEPLQKNSQSLPLHYSKGEDFSRFQSAVAAFNDCVCQLQMRESEDLHTWQHEVVDLSTPSGHSSTGCGACRP